MKKIIISLFAAIGALMLPSCSDMLDTESSRQLFDKELDSKTDSVHFAFGVMQAMQQLADQYVYIGEMRGDLVKTTEFTDNNLRRLADFSADTSNKYDSAYVMSLIHIRRCRRRGLCRFRWQPTGQKKKMITVATKTE